MPFVKLDTGMLRSTLWVDRDGRDLFITALLMAVPHELREPTPQLCVSSLEETGWTVPPGWYGLVEAAGPGIAHFAGVPWDIAAGQLQRMGEPEPESRSQDYDGRRMVRINGGYIVLNYDRYRTRDYGAAERMKRYRARRDGYAAGVTLPRHVTQAEAEAEVQAEAIKTVPSLRSGTVPTECGYCGATPEQTGFALEPDHFIPRSANGSDDPSNIIYACHRCNQAKGDRIFKTVDDLKAWLHRAYWTSNRQRWVDHRPFAFGGQPPPGLGAMTKAVDEGFEAFWRVYPKKVGKGSARAAWGKVKPSGDVVQAVERQKRSKQWLRDGGRYIPNPATWLNQQRWDDEPDPDVPHLSEKTIANLSAGEAFLRGDYDRK